MAGRRCYSSVATSILLASALAAAVVASSGACGGAAGVRDDGGALGSRNHCGSCAARSVSSSDTHKRESCCCSCCRGTHSFGSLVLGQLGVHDSVLSHDSIDRINANVIVVGCGSRTRVSGCLVRTGAGMVKLSRLCHGTDQCRIDVRCECGTLAHIQQIGVRRINRLAIGKQRNVVLFKVRAKRERASERARVLLGQLDATIYIVGLGRRTCNSL